MVLQTSGTITHRNIANEFLIPQNQVRGLSNSFSFSSDTYVPSAPVIPPKGQFRSESYYYGKQNAPEWAIGSLYNSATGSTTIQTVVCDPGNNVLVGGYFTGILTLRNFDGTMSNVYMAAGTQDAFIAKYSPPPTSNVLWAARMTSTGNDAVLSVSADPGGNVFATGYYTGLMNIYSSSNTYVSNLAQFSGQEMFIVKYGPSGEVIWGTRAVSSGNDSGNAVSADLGGNVYVTGAYTGMLYLYNTSTITSSNVLGYIYPLSGTSNIAFSNVNGVGGPDMTGGTGFIYPPGPQTGTTTTFPDGNYTVTASTNFSNQDPWRAFNKDYRQAAWTTSAAVYAGSTGNYFQAVTTVINGSNYGGEWLQIQMPKPIVLKAYFLTSYANRLPCRFKIAGSNNGSTWIEIDTRSTAPTAVLYPPVNSNTQTAYSYFRICVAGIVTYSAGDNYCSILEWFMYSNTGTSYNLQSIGNQDTFVAKYDPSGNILWCTSLGSSGNDSGTGISSDPDGNVYVTGFTNGIMNTRSNAWLTSTTASSVILNGTSREASDDNSATYWENYNNGVVYGYIANGSYVGTASIGGGGFFSTSESSNTWNGEWIQYSFTNPFVLKSYSLVGRSTFETTRTPITFVILGSTDKSTWNFINRQTNVSNVLYSSQATVSFTIPQPSTTPYANYRMVVLNLPSAGANNAVNIAELRLYEGLPTGWASGGQDVFLTKYGPAGNIIWSTFMSSSGTDSGNAVASESSGNVFVTGSYNGVMSFPSINTAAQYSTSNTAFVYPPMPMTAATTPSPLPTGSYIASASTNFAGNEPFRAFNYYDPSSGWITSGLTYAITTGSYNGVLSTTINGSAYLGEWLQIQMPTQVSLTAYKLVNTDTVPIRTPKTWKLAGSNNGSTWVEIDSKTNSAPISGRIITLTPSANTSAAYSYFRFVSNAVVGTTSSSYCAITELSLYSNVGYKYPFLTQTQAFASGQDAFLAKYDPNGNILWGARAVSAGTDSGNGVATDSTGNVYMTGNYTGALYLIGNTYVSSSNVSAFVYPPYVMTAAATTFPEGTYTASASTNFAGEDPFRAFNKNNNFPGWSTSTDLYAATTGYYTGAVSTTINGTAFRGEWLQIQMPQQVVLTSYQVVNTYEPDRRTPKTYKIAGSVDATTWVELDSQTVAPTGINTPPVNSNTIVAYNYFRLVSNQITNTAVSVYKCTVTEWYLYSNTGQTSNVLPQISGQDVFVAKYGPDGDVLWGANSGSTGTDVINGAAVNTSGNVYVTGTISTNVPMLTYASNGVSIPNTIVPTGATQYGFIESLNPIGNVVGTTRLGTLPVSSYNVTSVCYDNTGNIYATGGYTGYLQLYNSDGTLTSTRALDSNAVQSTFLAKYTSNGNVIWSAPLQSTGTSVGNGVAADAAGNVFVTGNYTGPMRLYNSTGTALANTLAQYGGQDVFLAKYSPTGNVLWGARTGSSGADSGNSVATDSSGSVYVTGYYTGAMSLYSSSNTLITQGNLGGTGYANTIYIFTTFTYTNIGATGRSGPTSLAGYGTSYPGVGYPNALTVTTGVQQYTISAAGTYSFIVAGALGGSASSGQVGGVGNIISGNVYLQVNDQIFIVTGQVGGGSSFMGGGGGGTFVFLNSASNYLFAAGGGGGGGNGTAGQAGRTVTSGGNGLNGSGGTNGNGGAGGTNGSGGIGGFNKDNNQQSPTGSNVTGVGATPPNGIQTGGGGGGAIGAITTLTFTGGAGGTGSSVTGGVGSFGGGGGAGSGNGGGGGGGGGGGYSGGGGGGGSTGGGGGGGGGGSNVSTLVTGSSLSYGTNSGAGYVIMTRLSVNDDAFGAGGGGASQAGSSATLNGTLSTGGNGGNGLQYSISGTPTYYGGGGGGTIFKTASSPGTGGLGGGGSGGQSTVGTDGINGTGGGGGGGGMNSSNVVLASGKGGDGIVIMSYTSGTLSATGGTVTTNSGNTIHTYTVTGSNTFAVTSGGNLNTLVVGGGGGGGVVGGGGGGGGVLYKENFFISPGTYSVFVGSGGASVSTRYVVGNSGTDSLFYVLRAFGGGGGGGYNISSLSGGSSGGSGTAISTVPSVSYPSSGQLPQYGGQDVFLAKYGPSGDVQWGAYMGSPGADSGTSVATDVTGNVYVTGYYTGLMNLYSSSNTYVSNLAQYGGQDVFIVKYDTNGQVRWGARTGSPGTDAGTSLATDVSGNVYVTGYYTGLMNIYSSSNVYVSNLSQYGGQDVFLIKYGSSGEVRWGARTGSPGTDSGNGVAVDVTGNVYMSGYYTGLMNLYSSSNVYVSNLAQIGGQDVFVAQYDLNGNVLGAARAGSSGTDTSTCIACDPTRFNTVCFGGTMGAASTFYKPQVNSIIKNYTTLTTGYTSLLTFPINPTPYWSLGLKTSGLTDTETITSSTVDTSGNVFVAGFFTGSSIGVFPNVYVSYNSDGTVTSNTYAQTQVYQNAFLTKYNSTGTVLWSATLESATGTSAVNGIAADSTGNVFVTGYYTGLMNIYSSSKMYVGNLAQYGGQDVFIVKYGPSGEFLWGARTGSPGADAGNGVTTDSSGNVFVTGYYTGLMNIYSSSNTYVSNLVQYGGQDVFLVKYGPSGEVRWGARTGSPGADSGTSVATDSTGNVFVTGYYTGLMNIYSSSNTYVSNLAQYGGQDVFLVKYGPSGEVQWGARSGSAGTDAPTSVATDSTGNVYMTGYYNGVMSILNSVNPIQISSSNASAFVYPPIPMTGATIPSPLPIGTYTASASSNFSGEDPWRAFNKINDYPGWTTNTGAYAASTGYYTGAFSTTINGTAFRGEWLQLQTPSPIVLTAYQLVNTFDPDRRTPKTYKIAGSTNGTTWVEIDSRTVAPTGINIPPANSNSLTAYNYFRLVSNQVTNTQATTIFGTVTEWYLYSNVGYTYTNLPQYGGQDVFLAKYDPNGNVAWGAYMGSSGTDAGNSVATDSSGSVYVTGYYTGTMNLYSSSNTAFVFTQGYPGGNGTTGATPPTTWVGGGGGGAGQIGANGSGITGGKGGDGLQYSISGTPTYYAGGGGGGSLTIGGATPGAGGLGGGGAGGSSSVGVSGTNGLGGGGGSGSYNGGSGFWTGGAGGSGTVIMSYATGTLTATGGTVTTSGGNTIHTYTVTGSNTFVVTSGGSLNTLIVAGGGSGGSGQGGGGGGGGLLYRESVYVPSGIFTVIVGAGGPAPATASAGVSPTGFGGGNSSFFQFSTNGGGGGAAYINSPLNGPLTGGSGGGGGITAAAQPGSAALPLGQLSQYGGQDVFLAKYGPSGDVLWGARAGSSGTDNGTSVDVDASGNVYVTGTYNGLMNLYSSSNTYVSNLALVNTTQSGFLAKYDQNGIVQNTNRSGSSVITGSSITISAISITQSNIYVTGYMTGISNFYNSNNAVSTTQNVSTQDVFVAKYSQTGNLYWVSKMTSTGADSGAGVATDTAGNVYVNGTYTGPLTIYNSTGSAFSNVLPQVGGSDAFLVKYGTNGNVIWAAYQASTGTDGGSCIGTDPSGNVFTIGYYSGTMNLYSSSNIAFSNTYAALNNQSVFVAKYSPNGQVLWGARSGSTGGSASMVRAFVDSSGNVYSVGQATNGAYTIYNSNASVAYQAGGAGSSTNGYAFKYDKDGRVVWVMYITNTAGNNGSSAITGDNLGNIYVGGGLNTSGISTFRTTFDASTISNTSGLLGPNYVLKMTSNGSIVAWAPVSVYPNGASVSHIKCDLSGNVYVSGTFSGPLTLYNFSSVASSPLLGNAGGNDAYIYKFEQNGGNVLWRTSFSSGGYDACFVIELDSTGSEIICAGIYPNATISFYDATAAQIYSTQTSLGGATNSFLTRFPLV